MVVCRDAMTLCAVNGGTSILAGFVVFSVLGYMAHVANKSVAEIVKPGGNESETVTDAFTLDVL